jgi:histone H3/H4
MANASKDLLIQLSMSFVTSLSAKANVVCGEHGKKTIFPEHVFESLHAQK